MYSKFMWLLTVPLFISTPLTAMCFNSILINWIILELNLMTFIPIIIYFNKNNMMISIKYYTIQSLSSMMFLMPIFTNSINENISQISSSIMTISILIKLGTIPFHVWFINILNNMSWITCFILMTWQKLIPMMLLIHIYEYKTLYISILISSIFSAIFGINHQSIRMILGYSSINHLSWMMLSILTSKNLWIFYFISYFIMNIPIILIFHKFNIFFINQLNLFKIKINKFHIIMNFLSLSSLPPLFGFYIKWYMMFMNLKMSITLVLIMIFMSILTFFFYTNIMINLFLNYKIESKLTIMNKFLNLKFNYLNYLFILMYINLWFMNIWLI